MESKSEFAQTINKNYYNFEQTLDAIVIELAKRYHKLDQGNVLAQRRDHGVLTPDPTPKECQDFVDQEFSIVKQALVSGDPDSLLISKKWLNRQAYGVKENPEFYQFLSRQIIALGLLAYRAYENHEMDKAWSLLTEARYHHGILFAERISSSLVDLRLRYDNLWNYSHITSPAKREAKKIDQTSQAGEESAAKRKDVKDEFLALLNNPNINSEKLIWTSANHAVDYIFDDYLKVREKYLSNPKPFKKSTAINFIESKNKENEAIFETFIVNYEGAIAIKKKFTMHLTNNFPSEGWTPESAHSSFIRQESEVDRRIVKTMTTDKNGVEKIEYFSRKIDLIACMKLWLDTDENFKRAFSGKLNQKNPWAMN
ncbi:MAG: hypothetical protein NVS3B3_10140 [Aquirhabdus sp.]